MQAGRLASLTTVTVTRIFLVFNDERDKVVATMHRLIKPFAKICAVFLFFVPLFALKADPGESKIHLGFIGALSGPGKSYGTACKNGIEMGRDPSRLDVTYEDDQFDPKKSVLAFKKLVEIDKVDVIVTLGSSPTQAVAPIAQKAKIPVIAWASDERVSEGRRFVIRSWPKGTDEGKAIAMEARTRRIKRPALIVATDDYSQSILRGMTEEFQETGLASTQEVEPSAQDFRSILVKLKNSGADALGTCLSVGQVGTFTRQARELGITLPIFGCISLDDPNEWSLANGNLSGAWYVTGNVDAKFRSEYKERFGNEDIVTGAAVHFDVAKLLGDIGDRNQSSADLLETILASGQRKGAVGDFRVVSQNNDRFFSVPLVVKTVP